MGHVAHELMHVLGIWHMFTRDDRDNYITVDLTNVAAADQSKYNKFPASEIISYTSYEYGSVMHHDTQYLASSGSSLTPISDKYLRTLGSNVISFYDISMINYHYKCNGVCATKGANCINGGTRNPKNCNACICPAGYGGLVCAQRPAGCGETLIAATGWKSKKFSIGNAAVPTLRQAFTVCNHWVQAPAGKRVQVQVTDMTGVDCNNGCWAQAIEPKICCPGQLREILTSTTNLTPIVSYNRLLSSTFTFIYRYI
ncbi:unnamed protein product [Heligmosomoides polygyrus]|uniref:Metalloendopeptidase n=1 Tax=Heligmosomoides polygyrus TaxID=6339 RepID=A0A183F4G6_HELPZ|nr:unnamed protein product [Heligmosomoides polygyrus]